MCWLVPAERFVTFDGTAVVMPLVGDHRVDDVPPLASDVVDLLAVEVDVEDD